MPGDQVGWDLTTINVHIDFMTKAAVIYLTVTALVLVLRICRWWAILGFSTATKTHLLHLAAKAIEVSDWPLLRAIGRRFSRWSLHRGLRHWANPEHAADRNAVALVLRQASEQFRCRWIRETSSVDDLLQWMATTKLVLVIFSVTEVTNLFTGAAQFKAIGNSAAFGTFGQIGKLWIVGLWLILAMHLAHWCFSARLARQREGWLRFAKAFRSWSGSVNPKPVPAASSGSNPIS